MATKANLVIDQGSTFNTDLTMTDEYGNILTLTGYTANSQMRKWYTSINITASFSTNIDIDKGIISLGLTANQTSAISSGRYVYDVEISDGVNTSRIVEGIVTVTPQVTK
jgi:hypothetical protein